MSHRVEFKSDDEAACLPQTVTKGHSHGAFSGASQDGRGTPCLHIIFEDGVNVFLFFMARFLVPSVFRDWIGLSGEPFAGFSSGAKLTERPARDSPPGAAFMASSNVSRRDLLLVGAPAT